MHSKHQKQVEIHSQMEDIAIALEAKSVDNLPRDKQDAIKKMVTDFRRIQEKLKAGVVPQNTVSLNESMHRLSKQVDHLWAVQSKTDIDKAIDDCAKACEQYRTIYGALLLEEQAEKTIKKASDDIKRHVVSFLSSDDRVNVSSLAKLLPANQFLSTAAFKLQQLKKELVHICSEKNEKEIIDHFSKISNTFWEMRNPDLCLSLIDIVASRKMQDAGRRLTDQLIAGSKIPRNTLSLIPVALNHLCPNAALLFLQRQAINTHAQTTQELEFTQVMQKLMHMDVNTQNRKKYLETIFKVLCKDISLTLTQEQMNENILRFIKHHNDKFYHQLSKRRESINNYLISSRVTIDKFYSEPRNKDIAKKCPYPEGKNIKAQEAWNNQLDKLLKQSRYLDMCLTIKDQADADLKSQACKPATMLFKAIDVPSLIKAISELKKLSKDAMAAKSQYYSELVDNLSINRDVYMLLGVNGEAQARAIREDELNLCDNYELRVSERILEELSKLIHAEEKNRQLLDKKSKDSGGFALCKQ